MFGKKKPVQQAPPANAMPMPAQVMPAPMPSSKAAQEMEDSEEAISAEEEFNDVPTTEGPTELAEAEDSSEELSEEDLIAVIKKLAADVNAIKYHLRLDFM